MPAAAVKDIAYNSIDADTTTYDFEGGDLTGFTTGGDANWAVATDQKHGGTYSAKSGDIGNSQTSWLKLTKTIPAPGAILTFFVRTSCEGGYDLLNFYIDDVKTRIWSGEVAAWYSYSVFLSPGIDVELKWSYEKDGADSVGSDCAWIDDIQILSGGMIAGLFKSDYSVISEQLLVGTDEDYSEPLGPHAIYAQGADASNVMVFANSARTAVGGFYIEAAATFSFQLGAISADGFGFFVNNGNPSLSISSAGKVGVNMATAAATATLQVNGDIALVDGMTAPDTLVGYARIYIDSGDGDLKIKFADGTIKTIVVDT